MIFTLLFAVPAQQRAAGVPTGTSHPSTIQHQQSLRRPEPPKHPKEKVYKANKSPPTWKAAMERIQKMNEARQGLKDRDLSTTLPETSTTASQMKKGEQENLVKGKESTAETTLTNPIKEGVIDSILQRVNKLEKEADISQLSKQFMNKYPKEEYFADSKQEMFYHEKFNHFSKNTHASALGEIAFQQFPNLKVNLIATELFFTFRAPPKSRLEWESTFTELMGRLYDFNKAMSH